MKNLKLTGFLFLFVFLASCVGSAPSPSITLKSDADYYDDRIRNDTNRDDVLSRSRARLRGNTCEKELEKDKNHDCEEQCGDIYSRRADREDCEELTVRQIEILVGVHEAVEDPDDDVLADLDLEDFNVYLNVSIEPFDKLIRKYSSREAKEVLLWIAENEDVTEIIKDEDDDYKNLASLLDKLDSNNSGADLWRPFVENIDSGDKLMEVVIEEGNEVALSWFQDYINEQAICDEETEERCFEIYCKIGEGIGSDSAQDWLGYEDFQKYIDDVIEEGTNANDGDGTEATPYYWGNDNNEFEDESDVNDWVEDLCENGLKDLTANN